MLEMTPFTFKKIQLKQTTIYICSFSFFSPRDYINYLSAEEQERLFSFKSVNRRMEFVASRILRHSIFGFNHIQYNDSGAPYIEGLGFISISHCKNKVAIALNNEYKLGLDLETPRENILDISHKFLSDHEKSVFDITNKLTVTKIWSAKEALYKLAGRKKIHFKSELLLDIDKANNWTGTIINPNHRLLVKLNIFEQDEIIISINDKQIERIDD